MVGIPALISFLAIVKANFSDKTISINANRASGNNNIIIDSFFLIFLLLLIFRNKTVGIDLANYEFIFNVYKDQSLLYIFNQFFTGKIELGYILICKFAAIFSNDLQLVLTIVALISLVPIWMFYRKSNLSHPFLAIVLFLNIGLFPLYFSALRQVMAIAFMPLAYKFTKEKKLLMFLLTILCAFLFHKSAIIALLFYPVYNIKLNKKSSLFYIIPVIAVVLIFSRQIFSFLIRFMESGYIDKYGAGIQSTGAYSILLLLFIFLLFSYFIPNENNLSREAQGLRNILALSTILQTFASVHNVAMRMNYYYLLFIPVLISMVIDAASAKNKKIALISVLVMVAFFTVYYFYTAFNGADILHIYPYIPMWRNI